MAYRQSKEGKKANGHSLETLIQQNCISLPTDGLGRKLRSNTVIFSESELYQMLLRGHAPQSEPFRKWGTEEVLPTIRKTEGYSPPQKPQHIDHS